MIFIYMIISFLTGALTRYYWIKRREGIQEIKKFLEYIKAEQKKGLLSIGWSCKDLKGRHPNTLDELIDYLESGFTREKAQICKEHNLFNEAIEKGKIDRPDVF